MSKRERNEKRSVALFSIVAAIFMIAGKATAGLMTGSLAILTDALHSFLDMGASIITYFAVRISDKPADRDHHFGHGKVESLAALFQVMILLVTCGWIVFEAIGRITDQTEIINISYWAYIVIIGSIAIDITRVRSLRRVAKKYHSQALAADALNFSTDIYSSLVVLFSMAAVHFGFGWADPLAAIAVAVFISVAVVRMAKQSIDVLLDRAPDDTEAVIRKTINSYPEVINVNRLRLRSDGRMTFAELSLDIDRSLSFGLANEMAERLEADMLRRLPRVDVTLSLNPVSRESEEIVDAVRYVVSAFNLTPHHLIISNRKRGYFISMHIEMSGEVTLNSAHDKTSEITERLHQSIDNLEKVVIHTEPFGGESEAYSNGEPDIDHISRRVKEIVESIVGVDDCHNIVLTPHKDGLALSTDMRLDGNLPLDKSHELSHRVESKLKGGIRELTSITLHLEPFKK